MSKKKILIVDDDLDILEFLAYNLSQAGYDIETESKSTSAITKSIAFKPDLILLDVMMPDIDGIELCEEIRKIDSLKHVLITFLTARSEDYSQIAGYEAGADDYIQKPIKPKVLISKLKALLKRNTFDEIIDSKKADNENIIANDSKGLTIDRNRYVVIKENMDYILPKKEFELLYLLASQPNKVFLRNEIYVHIWGNNSFVGDRTIDVHIRKLRKKFGDEIIKTVKGVGYKFSE